MSSATSTASPAEGSSLGRKDGSPKRKQAENSNQPSAFYTMVMTPLNFVTFLFSLVIIDLRYTLRRSHTHSSAPSRLPGWLHALLYRDQPYSYETRSHQGHARAGEEAPWYYHTKQKKLLKMEADEAFKFRSTMLSLLGACVMGAAVGFLYLAHRLFRSWIPA